MRVLFSPQAQGLASRPQGPGPPLRETGALSAVTVLSVRTGSLGLADGTWVLGPGSELGPVLFNKLYATDLASGSLKGIPSAAPSTWFE